MQPITLPYLSNSKKLDALSQMMAEPWAVMLDSAGENLTYNRYDIFSFAPTIKLSFKAGNVELAELQLGDNTQDKFQYQTTHIVENPIELMRELLKRYKGASKQNKSAPDGFALPFYGGWMGYISYDYGRYLETLPELTEDDINLPELQFGLYQWALITDHQDKTSRIYHFGLAQAHWSKVSNMLNQSIIANLSKFDKKEKSTTTAHVNTKDFKLREPFMSNTTKTEYQNAFAKIQNYIQAGDCYQVNYAQRFQAKFSGDIQQAYRHLSLHNKAPFSAFLNFDDYQILSLSPERFIESHQNNVITQPIKGTRPRSNDPSIDRQLGEDLINSDKDCAENLMIVDLLRNDLSKTAAKGSVKVSELFGHYRFESVHHLISTIESKLDSQFDNCDLLATTLPGGSITGAPKIRAMEIIEELEKVRRNIYCGIIGYIDFNDNMDTNICIRTLVAKDNTLYCWAGGGLVADSEVDTEYQETFDKLAKILPVLTQMSNATENYND
ncbi:aminodeoxychorismate synthase component I [Aliikangiella marina]|uniref:aminodeoxychorismate synthase n=1 Tax=Aliikangiella marina TaxID=1712262 RepID=A0A545TIL9_9GAMM|nr:aminodeoxychorismate synthase component I [Aliikangiella marina]TQV77065.1 aminodeoxychorismate synthase component I [Aliikangiella marina]